MSRLGTHAIVNLAYPCFAGVNAHVFRLDNKFCTMREVITIE